MKTQKQRIVILYTDTSSRLIKGDPDFQTYGDTAMTRLLNEGWSVSHVSGLGDGTAVFVLEFTNQ